MLSRQLLALAATATLACSPPTGAGAVVDVVRIHGVLYMECSGVAACPSDEIRLEGEHARVVRRIPAELAESDYRLRDGEATRLEAGTPLHVLSGHSPHARLAARQESEVRIYVAADGPGR